MCKYQLQQLVLSNSFYIKDLKWRAPLNLTFTLIKNNKILYFGNFEVRIVRYQLRGRNDNKFSSILVTKLFLVILLTIIISILFLFIWFELLIEFYPNIHSHLEKNRITLQFALFLFTRKIIITRSRRKIYLIYSNKIVYVKNWFRDFIYYGAKEFITWAWINDIKIHKMD